MSNIDPIKPKPFAPLAPTLAEPKKTEAKGDNTPAVNLGFVPSGPKPSYGTLFGPGVSGGVFANASPNIGSMSDQQLAAKTKQLEQAIRANPGKVNDEDIKTLAAMHQAAATRLTAKLTPTADPSTLSNKQLVSTLMAIDIARASGLPLTPSQEAWAAKGEGVLKERAKIDPNKEIAALQHKRKEAFQEVKTKCAAAAASVVALVDHSGTAGTVATAIVMTDEIKHGNYAGAAKEFVANKLSHLPYGKILDVIAAAENVAKCIEAKDDLEFIDASIETQKAKLGGAKP